MLQVRLSYRHGAQSGRILALIDSGADDCLFRADIGKAIGIKKIDSGIMGQVGRIVPDVKKFAFNWPSRSGVGIDLRLPFAYSDDG
jgi:hypothetical protein